MQATPHLSLSRFCSRASRFCSRASGFSSHLPCRTTTSVYANTIFIPQDNLT